MKSPFASYLDARGIKQAEFARLVGVDQSIVSRLRTGGMTPSLTLAAAIERETGGAIPAVSWVTDEAGAA